MPSSVARLRLNMSKRGKRWGPWIRNILIEAFIPVGVQGPLADLGGLGLLPVDGGHSEGVREPCILVLEIVLISSSMGIWQQEMTQEREMEQGCVRKTSLLYKPSAAMTGNTH